MNKNQLESLLNIYREILKLEISFGCKPTELRHLIGRMGEFHCALKTNGELAHTPNQHGFDVIAENGKMAEIEAFCRTWKDSYELDFSKLKTRLNKQ